MGKATAIVHLPRLTHTYMHTPAAAVEFEVGKYTNGFFFGSFGVRELKMRYAFVIFFEI